MKDRGTSRVTGFFPGKAAGVLAGAAALTLAMSGTSAAQTTASLAGSPQILSSNAVLDLGCATAHRGMAHCNAKALANKLSDGTFRMKSSAGPTGLTPADIQSAYGLGGAKSGGTVAIVDANDDPRAEQDLAVYRAKFGLPACTSGNGCFRKVNQHGKSAPLPAGDTGWGGEISLDLDAVSSACPSCKILLVEANSASLNDLGASVNTAAETPGVASISNSYGGSDSSADQQGDAYFRHSGVAITASSGDSGYGVEYPAASPYVTAVGGTTLKKASNERGWSETAWSGAGSGCSAFEPKPAWQHDTGCAHRTVADVSAVADPHSGLAVYDTYGQPGWLQVGGTSLSAPLIASVYALAGNTASIKDGSFPYSHPSALNDVTSGSNGMCLSYLCTAGPGYDGPTGLGTPNGTGAF